jgi:hypothetical protein
LFCDAKKYPTRDLIVRNLDYFIDELTQDRQRHFAGTLDRNTIGDRRHHMSFDRVAGLERRLDPRRIFSLHADHANTRLELLGRSRDARHQSAAADRNDNGRRIGLCLEYLYADSSLAGDDHFVVKGMHHRIAFFAAISRENAIDSSRILPCSMTLAP